MKEMYDPFKIDYGSTSSKSVPYDPFIHSSAELSGSLVASGGASSGTSGGAASRAYDAASSGAYAGSSSRAYEAAPSGAYAGASSRAYAGASGDKSSPSESSITTLIKQKFKDRDHMTCIDWLQEKCHESRCLFDHKYAYKFKSTICIGWKNKNCPYESIKCRFAHGPSDPHASEEIKMDNIYNRIDRASKTVQRRSRSRSRERDGKY
jgi:hypothetical protein